MASNVFSFCVGATVLVVLETFLNPGSASLAIPAIVILVVVGAFSFARLWWYRQKLKR